MKKTMLGKKLLCCALSLAVVYAVSVPSLAAESDNLSEMDQVKFSAEAGKHGYYEYDEETGEAVAVSPEEIEFSDISSVPPIGSMEEEPPIPNSIIGIDNRSKISNPTGRFESTCLIAARFNDYTVAVGTGWLINNTYVATAGHLLYQAAFGYAQHVAVYVGSSGGNYKQYRLGHYKRVGQDYVNHASGDSYNMTGMFDDWGVIKLDSPITVNTSYLGRYEVNSANDMLNRTYYTQGYPLDRNGGSSEDISYWNLYDMYATSGRIIVGRPRVLDLVFTDIDFTEGQSGSPVYSYRSGGYYAEAIIVASFTGGQVSEEDGQRENMIILINDWLMAYFNSL